MADIEEEVRANEAERAAFAEHADKITRRVHHGKDGRGNAYKTYLDSKVIDPRITLDRVRHFSKQMSKAKGKSVGRRILMWRPVLSTSIMQICFTSQLNSLQLKIIPLEYP